MKLDHVVLMSELEKQNLTQTRLAELAGVSPSTMYGVRAGRRCSEATAQKIAGALGVSLDTLRES